MSKLGGTIYIAGHVPPDWDAIAGAKALSDILKIEHPNAKIVAIFSSKKIEKYDVIFSPGDIIWTEGQDIADIITPTDLLILEDVSSFSRASRKGHVNGNALRRMHTKPSEEEAQNDPGFQTMRAFIRDHHTGEGDTATNKEIDPNKVAMGEHIYLTYKDRLLTLYQERPDLHLQISDIAWNLFLCIMSDTRGGKYIGKDNKRTQSIMDELIFLANLCEKQRGSRYKPQAHAFLFSRTRTLVTLQDILGNNMDRFYSDYEDEEGPLLPGMVSAAIPVEKFPLLKEQIPTMDGGDPGEARRNWMADRGDDEGMDLIFSINEEPGLDHNGKDVYFIGFRAQGIAIESLTVLTEYIFDGGGHNHATGGKFIATENEQKIIDATKEANEEYYKITGNKISISRCIRGLIMNRIMNRVQWVRAEDGRLRATFVNWEKQDGQYHQVPVEPNKRQRVEKDESYQVLLPRAKQAYQKVQTHIPDIDLIIETQPVEDTELNIYTRMTNYTKKAEQYIELSYDLKEKLPQKPSTEELEELSTHAHHAYMYAYNSQFLCHNLVRTLIPGAPGYSSN